MDIIVFSILLVCLTYWLSQSTKRPVGRPKKHKKFGEGLLQDSNAHDWWKPGNGGI